MLEQPFSIGFLLNGVAVYQEILKDRAIAPLVTLLSSPPANACDAASLYAQFFAAVANSPHRGCLPDYLFDKVLRADNFFSQECAANRYLSVPLWIKNAVEQELNTIASLAYFPPAALKKHLCALYPDYQAVICQLPDYKERHIKYTAVENWGDDLTNLAKFYKANGVGVFSQEKYFLFSNDAFVPATFSPLPSLKERETEKAVLLHTMQRCLSSQPYDHLLLTNVRHDTIAFVLTTAMSTAPDLKIVDLAECAPAQRKSAIRQLENHSLFFLVVLNHFPSLSLFEAMQLVDCLQLNNHKNMIFCACADPKDAAVYHCLASYFKNTLSFL